jgi:hypothetical protein
LRFVARKEEKANCGVVSPFYSLLPAGYSLPQRGLSQVMAFQSPDSNRLKAGRCNSRRINQGVKRLTYFEKSRGWDKRRTRGVVSLFCSLLPTGYSLPLRGSSQVMAFQSPDSNGLKAASCNSRQINQGVKRLTHFGKSQGGQRANRGVVSLFCSLLPTAIPCR